MRALGAIFTFFIILVAGCTADRMQVTVDHDGLQDYASYETYTFKGGKQVLSSQPFDRGGDKGRERVHHNKRLDASVNSAVDNALSDLGYKKADGTADFYVSYRVSTERRLQASGDMTVISGGAEDTKHELRRREDFSKARRKEYEMGILKIQITDAATNRVVWRAGAQSPFDFTAEAKEKGALIQKAVQRMFEQFPKHEG